MAELKTYVHTLPSRQNAIDLFAGEWTSEFPPECGALRAGGMALYADSRLVWALEQLGGVSGKTVLELGPLEGSHSYMLDRAGAAEIRAIEGNSRAFLRCLVFKEIAGLPHVNFELGDFTLYLDTSTRAIDVILATGVLYHLSDPIRALYNIARLTTSVFIWTHYYDATLIERNARLLGKFGSLEQAEFQGFRYRRAEFRYEKALDWSGFCGGNHTDAMWLPREDLLRALRHFGFDRVSIAYEEPSHDNGPSFAIVASK